MNTDVAILGVGVDDGEVGRAAVAGQRLAEHWEATFSRFRADSHLSRLNAANGGAVRLDPECLDLLDAARSAVFATGGRFDPSILPALEGTGYDRSFELISDDDRPAPARCPGFGVEGWAAVTIDRERGEASLPPGMRIDLGGIAKGAFVDRLAAAFAGWPGGCIDAGGDLLAWGLPPSGDEWRIGIEDPSAPGRTVLEAVIPAGMPAGVATSGIHRRRWRVGGREAHHLIDPRTGQPTDGAVLGATALAGAATAAEIATKALMVAATEAAPPRRFGAWLALVFRADGRIDAVTEGPTLTFDREPEEPSHVPPLPTIRRVSAA